MNYWLVKSEPDAYSWENLEKDGNTIWDGVRNYQARNNLRAMCLGDLVLFYHSNIGKEIVGICKVTKTAYKDPTTNDERWLVVELAPVKKLLKPVSLESAKSDPRLKDMQLVTNMRLSVQKVTSDQFEYILSLAKTKLGYKD